MSVSGTKSTQIFQFPYRILVIAEAVSAVGTVGGEMDNIYEMSIQITTLMDPNTLGLAEIERTHNSTYTIFYLISNMRIGNLRDKS